MKERSLQDLQEFLNRVKLLTPYISKASKKRFYKVFWNGKILDISKKLNVKELSGSYTVTYLPYLAVVMCIREFGGDFENYIERPDAFTFGYKLKDKAKQAYTKKTW